MEQKNKKDYITTNGNEENNSSTETDKICMIQANDGSYGTGFFCKILEMNVLLTCFNVVKKKDIKEIYYYINNKNDNKLTIKCKNTWCDEGLDYFCVELDKDCVQNHYNVDEVININKDDSVSSLGYSFDEKKKNI